MANFTTNIEAGIQEAFDKNGAVQIKPLYINNGTSTKPFFRSSNIFQANKTKNLPMNYVQISVEDQLADFSSYATQTKEIEKYFSEVADFAYQTITSPAVGEQKFFSDLLDSASKEFSNASIIIKPYLFSTFQSPIIPPSITKAMPLFLTGKEFNYKICDAFIKVSKNTQFQTIFVYHDILTNNKKIPDFFDSQLKEDLSYLQISVVLEFTKDVQKIKFYVIPQLSFETIKVPLFGGGFIETPSSTAKPLFETKFSNKLFPPVIPNVNITSYQNVNNKVVMFLSKNLGPFISYANEPAFFTKEQFDQSKQIIEKKKGLTYEPNLIYSFSQNKERYFVIYRTETRPKNYSGIIKEQNVIRRLDITKLQTSLLDTVSPNTKYYYCFRVEDIDGVASDVTLIYEIEIVDESGTIYMKQNVFKPEKIKTFKKTLPFENRTRISPTSLQIKIPDDLIQTKFDASLKIYVSKQFNLGQAASFIGKKNNSLKLGNQEILVDKQSKALLSINNFTEIDLTMPFIYLIGDRILSKTNSLSTQNIVGELLSILNTEIVKTSQIFNDTGIINSPFPNFTFNNFFEIIKSYDEDFVLEVVLKNGSFFYRPESPNFNPGFYLKQNNTFSFINGEDKLNQETINNFIDSTLAESILDKNSFTVPNSIFDSNKQFKARIQSLNSKKKFDLNINYNIEIVEGIKTLSESGITKNFEILQTEEI